MTLDEAGSAELLGVAARAMEHAHCPYSGFAVGAAVLASSGRVYGGCNVENASYPLALCAERVAIAAAVSQGEREFTALAVVAAGPLPPRPCGACLQVMAEFCPDLELLLAAAGRGVERRRLSDLLPEPFRLKPEGGR